MKNDPTSDPTPDEWLKRLREGKGVEVTLGSRSRNFRVVIIPGTVYSDRMEVMIASESCGALFWDGQAPLNEFKFVQHGFSLPVGKFLTRLLEELMSTAATSAAINAQQGHQPRLTQPHQKTT